MEYIKRYRVVKDLQGDEFGMYRDYTIEQWRQQAIDWAEMDENDGVVERLKKMSEEQILPYIADFWTVEFAEVDENEDENFIVYYSDGMYNTTTIEFESLFNAVMFYNGLKTKYKYIDKILPGETESIRLYESHELWNQDEQVIPLDSAFKDYGYWLNTYNNAVLYVKNRLTNRRCNRCKKPVLKSDVDGYQYQCFEHDEDLYTIETFVSDKAPTEQELQDIIACVMES